MKRPLNIVAGLTLGLLFYPMTSMAQLERRAYGIMGHYVAAMHNADFQSLPDVPCCSRSFGDGSGSGMSLGILYQTPLSPSWTLSGRLLFMPHSGVLTNDEPTTVNIAGRPVNGIIRHELVSSLSSLSIEPLIGYRVTDRLTVHAGPTFGYMMQNSFTQTEGLIEPSQGALNVAREVGSGALPNASSLYGAFTAGLSFDIPLFRGSRWFLTPEVMYSVGLTDIVSNLNWSVNSLRVGVALKYSPPMLDLPNPPIEKSVRLVAAVKAFGLQAPGAEPEAAVRLTIEEFLSRTHKPLLPYIFFESGSDKLEQKYRRISTNETSGFNPERFNDTNLVSVYYNILNIVGRRMRDNQRSTITLTGCNSNEGVEKGNLTLSQRRADVVKAYLTNVWGIEPARIDVRTRNLPANPSNVTKSEGMAENRRTEISSNDPAILAPLVTRDTTRIASPPIVRFVIESESAAGVGSYSLAAKQDNVLLQAFNGEGEPPQTIDWYLQDNLTSLPKTETPLQYDIRVADRGAQEFTSPTDEISVHQITIAQKRRERLGDKEIVRYTLMSFGFGRADVEQDNVRYLDEVKKDISEESTVTITGSTDLMGDEGFNQNLSEKRARSVARVLRAKDSRFSGVGEQSYFDNAIPEGRFYNRTVHLLIENPLK